MVAVIVVASSMVAGVINAFILDLPLKIGGDGIRFWLIFALRYSADRIIRPGDGSAAFFNDLARELIAIMLIPSWFAAVVLPRWACAVQRRWTLPCRYYNAQEGWRWFPRLSCTALF